MSGAIAASCLAASEDFASAPSVLACLTALAISHRRLSTLKDSLQQKKRSQAELIAATCESTSMDEDDDPGSLVAPASTESDDEFTSRPKRRSVSVDINAPWTSRASTDSRRQSMDRRTSLELWQEARRQRCVAD